jgi:hypothetical protein
MTLNLDGIIQADLEALNQVDDYSANRLPFPALYAFWRNGKNSKPENAEDVNHYGGWAIVGESVENTSITLPEAFARNEYEKDGETKISYTKRTLSLAIFSSRKHWENSDTGAIVSQPIKGYSPRIQYLAALRYDKTSQPVPIVINLDGYQVTYFSDALEQWRKVIRPLIKELTAQKLDYPCFWTQLGTVGKFETREVGKGKNTKKINFVSVYIPENFTAAELGKRFIGVELVRQCAEWKAKSEAWLNFYKNNQTAAPVSANGYPTEAHAEPESDNILF